MCPLALWCLSSRGAARGVGAGSVVPGSPSHPRAPMSASPSPSRPAPARGAVLRVLLLELWCMAARPTSWQWEQAAPVIWVPRRWRRRNNYESVLQVSLILLSPSWRK